MVCDMNGTIQITVIIWGMILFVWCLKITKCIVVVGYHHSNLPNFQYDNTNVLLQQMIKTPVGKANDLNVRPNVSGKSKGLTKTEQTQIKKTDYPGKTHTELEVLEHKRIQEITGGVPARKSPNVLNKKDSIGPARRYLLDE